MGLVSGTTNSLTIVVDESMTADRFGNTGVQVLATPMLVSYFELAAHQLAMPALEPGQGTVGSHIDIRHLAATPIGMRVTVRATLTERDGRRLLSGSRPTTTTSVSVRAPTNASSSTCRGSWDASPPKAPYENERGRSDCAGSSPGAGPIAAGRHSGRSRCAGR